MRNEKARQCNCTDCSRCSWDDVRGYKKCVDNGDLWIMLLSTIRYSMGRMTYMSSLAPELVVRHAAALTCQQLRQVIEEIDGELKRAERNVDTLGMSCDHEEWKKGLANIRRVLGTREWMESHA